MCCIDSASALTTLPILFDLEDKEPEQHVFPAQANGASDETRPKAQQGRHAQGRDRIHSPPHRCLGGS